MNALFEAWQSPAAQKLGWVLVHFVWQATLIALLFRLASLALRRCSASLRYLAGCFSLALMAVAPLATYVWLNAQADKPTAALAAAGVPAAAVSSPDLYLPASVSPITETLAVERSKATWLGGTFMHPAKHYRLAIQLALPWVVVVWAIGVHCLGLRLLFGWLAVQRLRRSGITALPAEVLQRAQRLASRLCLGRSVQFVQSALVEVPTVLGWLKPVVLLPAGCLVNLSPAQLEAILAHELAHVRRHDYLVNLLQSLLETLFFYHPAVWWLSAMVRQERENCCDDLAVTLCGSRFAYARALISLEELRQPENILAMASQGGDLQARILRLMGRPVQPVPSGHFGKTAVAAIAAMGLAIMVLFQLASTAADVRPAEGRQGEKAEPAKADEVPAAKPEPAARLQFEARLSEGSLEIVEAPNQQVSVEVFRLEEGRRQRDADIEKEITIVQKDNRIEPFVPRGLGRDMVFRFYVPAQCNQDLSTSHGDITVGNFAGDLEASVSVGNLRVGKLGGKADLRSSAGHIFVGEVGGTIKARSSGGSIKLGELKGAADLFASGGDIRVKSAAAKIEARTSGGNIKIFRALEAIEASASGGNVQVNLTGQPGGQVSLKSDGGAILAQVAPKLNLAVQAEGEIKGDLPVVWDAKENQRNRKGKLNDGGVAFKARAGKIQLDTLNDDAPLALGEEQWNDRMEMAAPAREGDRNDRPKTVRDGDAKAKRGRTIIVWIEDFKDGILTVVRRADAGDRVITVKVTDATEVWREIDAWEAGAEGRDRQRKQVRATPNWLDKGSKIQLTQVAEGEAASIVVVLDPKAVAPREGDAPRREGERADQPRDDRERELAGPRIIGGDVSTSVRTVNGQTVVTLNGKEVWTGPTRGQVGARSRMVDGETFIALFEGDQVLWENVPGAAAKVKNKEVGFRRDDGVVREVDRPDRRETEPPVKPVSVAPVKLIAKGIFMRDGTFMAAEVLSADDTQVKYRQADGKEASVLLARVAVLLLKPFPESKQEALERDRRGLLLENGDFFESELRELNAQSITVNSVLFGQRKYDAGKQVQAVILRGAKPSGNTVPNTLKGFEPVGIKPPAEGEKK